jgi:hypothetical protein
VGELGGFGDIETVVHLVRVAMDTIGHWPGVLAVFE